MLISAVIIMLACSEVSQLRESLLKNEGVGRKNKQMFGYKGGHTRVQYFRTPIGTWPAVGCRHCTAQHSGGLWLQIPPDPDPPECGRMRPRSCHLHSERYHQQWCIFKQVRSPLAEGSRVQCRDLGATGTGGIHGVCCNSWAVLSC